MNTKDTSVIPAGIYCYGVPKYEYEQLFNKELHRIDLTNVRKTCPYWSINKDYPHQMNGYCSFLDKGDWEDFGLLWDKCKECDIDTDACDWCGKVTNDVTLVETEAEPDGSFNYYEFLCSDCAKKVNNV